jgi:hypothetical protein
LKKPKVEELSVALGFWVAQRFSAAVTASFGITALAAEVSLRRRNSFSEGT